MQDKRFKWFPADTADPCEKYKQPEPNEVDLTSKSKDKAAARGKGAATKGYYFYPDD